MSTDKQSEASPEDQIAECRRFAEAKGWEVPEDLVVREAGVSGASRHNRPGLLELVARIAEWDVLLCFESSRLARNGEDFSWVLNRLRAHRRQGFEVTTGLELSNVGSRVMSVLNEEYLVKLRADVQRGLRGRVERRFFAGGTPYGYRTVAVPSGQTGPHGEAVAAGYRLEPDEERAPVVRRIFSLYASGQGYRAIAHRLNREGIPSPRGRRWSPAALQPLLGNPIYRGEYVWNRSEWVKDHESGRRRRIERPESEWLRQHDEAWRIVPEELWHAVQERRRGRRPREARCKAGGRATGKHLLSGLLECGACGGGFWRLNQRDEFGCGWRKDRGAAACASTLRVPHEALADRVLGALGRQVLAPELADYIVARATELAREELSEESPERDHERLEELDAQIERAVDLGLRTGGLDAVTRRLEALRAEREAVATRLERAGPAPGEGALREAVERRFSALRETLAGDPEEARPALRALVPEGRLRVLEDAERGFRVEGLVEVPMDDGPGGACLPGPSRQVAGVASAPGEHPGRLDLELPMAA